MGIKDLLKFMKPYIQPIHIKNYAGKRVGIDAYSWLHKGAYSCSMELCLNSDGEKKLRYLDYFMHRINLLRHYKITPVVVFDGGNVPCKAATEHERHRRTMANRDLAMEKLKEGNVSAASELFQRAVSITPTIAHQLIQVLRSENVEFVVAPYEADAQLAYLSSLEVEKGGVAAVITEDSDLVAYGCQAIVFKMDRFGNGEEIVLDKIFDSAIRTPSFRNFDKELFTGMCVLAGCDFLPSIPGIGIVKAYGLVSKYRNLERVLSVLKFEKGNQVPEDYSKSFREAVAVFQHAQIYDADMKKLKHIKPLPQNLLQSLDGELDFLGPTNGIREIPPSVATAIAEGNMDPISMETFDCSPSPRYDSVPIRIQRSGRLPRVEAAATSARNSCFVAFSSQKTREKKQEPVPKKAKYVNEVGTLEKLIEPSVVIRETEETTIVERNSPLKVPDNNPFKRIKLDEMPSFQMVESQVSVVTEIESLDTFLCVSPDSLTLEVPDEEFSWKGKPSGVVLCETKRISEVASGVTQEENLDVLRLTSQSQESVNSKPIVSGGKRKLKKKSEQLKSLETKNSSILNFFSRV
ncbi:hypothetical protein FNV43_RR19955 [Rhamnella rubrinervis]|uniref:Exonuclease 1 n=1 Tax=Rhamnella rubrinervis TaxID=2594499 RepID=A0A8K0GQ02_9ROSA|nr:hypothetical protein FNV43_RR19955 [Rhamnella rubrinervis]